MRWFEWKPLFEGLACLVGQVTDVACSLEEAAPPPERVDGRVGAFLREWTLVSILIWAGRRT